MEKDFTEWLKERYCAWYLLTQEQEDEYFSQWYDEMQENRKEQSKIADHTILYYEINECPQNPTDSGKYYGKTLIRHFEQGKLKVPPMTKTPKMKRLRRS